MRLEYNAPVVLTFALVCSFAMLLEPVFHLMVPLFSVAPNMAWGDPLSYIRLVSHAIGHANWQHLMGNFTLILLLGPILEEKYGSLSLLQMMFFTALVTGLLQIVFFHEGLMGASGIVFMMIVLSSLTNFRSGHIPLTFILVIVLFLGSEIISSFRADNVSQFAHIIGGACGAIFGFSRKKVIAAPPHGGNR